MTSARHAHHAARLVVATSLAATLLLAPARAQFSPLAGELLDDALISEGSGGFSGPIAQHDGFGSALVVVGDIDGDGVDDLAVGHPGDDGSAAPTNYSYGGLFILLMHADGTVKSQVEIDELHPALSGVLDNTGALGTSLAAPGDLDGDGIPDVVACEPGTYVASAQAWGALYVFLLQADGHPHTVVRLDHHDLTTTSAPIASLYDASLCALPDLDGNGLADLAVGLPADFTHGSGQGAVLILSLAADLSVATAHRIAAGEGGFDGILQDGEHFGSALAAIGDVDGDGHVDLMVGAPADSDGALASGSVWVLFLNADGSVRHEQKISNHHGLLGQVLDEGDQFGRALAGLGDLDRDGVPDVAVASPFALVGSAGNAGEVWLLFLDATGKVSHKRRLNDDLAVQPQPGARFGTGLAALGDSDSDGLPTLGVGVPGLSVGGVNNRGGLRRLELARHVWDDLGQGLAGAAGLPQLGADGSFAGGTTLTHVVSGAPANAPTWLVMGVSLLEAPFKFGVMVPALDLVLDGLSTDAGGALSVSATWPLGVPADVTLYQQYWFVDAGGPLGFSATNGVAGSTP